jgi:Putative addiction module component
MLTLDQLISEAIALPDAAKALLVDKIVESMTSQIDRDILTEGVQKAQERISEIDSGAVQTIPGDIALPTELVKEDANFFIANQEYPIWSPYNCSEAANTLMNLLATKQQQND